MTSINGKEYEAKYGTDHARAAGEYGAKKVYKYERATSDAAITYKMIHSESEEAEFLQGDLVESPIQLWPPTV